MKRCDQKKLFLEIFFPKNLEKTWSEVYDEKSEEDDEGNHDTCPHVEKIEQWSDKSSQSKCSAISHEYLGRMDVVKHKCHERSDHDSDHGSSDIGLIEEQDDSKDKKSDCHQSACETIESIGDIDSIDDCDSGEERDDRSEQSKRYLACKRPEIDIIYPQSAIKPSADECGKDNHTDQFRFSTQSFDSTMSFDIQEIINESYQSHTKETEE